MAWFCAVKGCTNKKASTKNSVVYHKFPGDDFRAYQWTLFCERGEGWTPPSNQGICSEHFDLASYDHRYRQRRQLLPDGIPVLNPPYKKVDSIEDAALLLDFAEVAVTDYSTVVCGPLPSHLSMQHALADKIAFDCGPQPATLPSHPSVVADNTAFNHRPLRPVDSSRSPSQHFLADKPQPALAYDPTIQHAIADHRTFVGRPPPTLACGPQPAVPSSPTIQHVFVDHGASIDRSVDRAVSWRPPNQHSLAVKTALSCELQRAAVPSHSTNQPVVTDHRAFNDQPIPVSVQSRRLAQNAVADHAMLVPWPQPVAVSSYPTIQHVIADHRAFVDRPLPTAVSLHPSNDCDYTASLSIVTYGRSAEKDRKQAGFEENSNMNLQQALHQNAMLTKELQAAQQRIEELKCYNQALAQQNENENKGLRKRMYDLEKKVRACESEHRNQEDMVQYMRETFEGVLSANQLDVILQRKKKPKWNSEELAMAFTLRYLSKRCYTYLRSDLKYPLPELSTLSSYASRLDLRHGLLVDVLRSMKTAGIDMAERDRACVLTFDEMSVRRLMEYDMAADEIVGPHSHVQVVMARGLFAKWKQTVFIAFDQRVTEDILVAIITSLHDASYNVVAVCSNNGAENVGLRTALGITLEKTSIAHPVTKEDIFIFGDAPHNLKLVRNWFVGEGIMWRGTRITANLIRKLIDERAGCELTPLFAINSSHVELTSAEKQNVAKAAKLLSHTTATVLRQRFEGTKYQTEAELVSQFIAICNDWFDVFNSHSPCAKLKQKRSYHGTAEQIQALDTMKDLMQECRGVQKNGNVLQSLAIFQKSIIMFIESLKGLYLAMCSKYGIEFLSAYKLNQDVLENLFSQVRTNGGLNDRPTPLSVIYRIRLIILGKTAGVVQRNANTSALKDCNPDEYLTATVLKKADIVPVVAADFRDEDDILTIEEDNVNLPSQQSGPWPSDILVTGQEVDGFYYLLEWVAFKMKGTHPDLGSPTGFINKSHVPQYLANLSYGGLTAPSPAFQVMGAEIEKAFIAWHGRSGFKNKLSVVSGVVNDIMLHHSNFDQAVVQRYVKIRMIARMRHINMHILGQLTSNTANQKYASTSAKRKLDKDLSSVIRKYKKLNSQ